MAGDLKLGIRLTADGKGFAGEIRVGQKALDKFTGSTKAQTKAARSAASATREQGSVIKSLHGHVLRYGAGILGITQIQRVFNAVFSKTIRQEQALAQVAARIRSTGEAAGYSTGALAEMAAELQQVTTFGDEEILEAQSVLLSFRNVAGKAFKGATEAALDLSIALKQDLKSTVIQLGKALDDPVTGLESLSKSGTKFSKTQQALIKKLAQTGQVAKAQALILKEIKVQYGGAAKAARDTLGGALDALGNTFGDLLEIQQEGTDTLKSWTETFNSALKSIDVTELHADIASIGSVVGKVASVLGGFGVASLAAWGVGAAKASIQTRWLAVTTAAAGAHIDKARLRMLAGAVAARRFGGAVRFASAALRGLSKGLAVFGGPLGIALLAAYSIYEFATANDAARDSLVGLDQDIDSYRISLEKFNRTQTTSAITATENAIQDKTSGLKAAQVALETLNRGRISFTPDFANQVGTFIPQKISYLPATEKEKQAVLDQVLDLQDEINRLIAKQPIQKAHLASLQNPGATTAKPPTFNDQGIASNASQGFQKLQTSLFENAQGPLEKLNDSYQANTALIYANTKAGSEARNNLLNLSKAQHEVALSAHVKQAADEKASQAAAKHQALIASGLPALTTLQDRHQELAAVTNFSAAALEEQSAKTSITNEVLRDYQGATEKTTAAIISQTLANDNLVRSLEKKSQAFEQVKNAELRYVEEIKALEDLKGTAGVDEGLRVIELEKLKSEQLLSVKRTYWEQELLEAEGFRSQAEAAENAHRHRLIDNQSANVPKVAAIQHKLVDLETKGGAEKLKAGLAVAQESFGLFAAHSKKAFKLQQLTAIASATISIAQGIATALAKPMPLGAIEAVLVAAAGAVQIAAIRAQQPPQAFALGGIVDSPTFFSARGVPRGVAGESGPEAILPLKRLPGGQLGVRAQGGGGDQHITFAPVIQVELTSHNGADADALGSEFGQAVLAQLEPAFRGLLMKELRFGGLLNRGDAV